VKRDEADRLAPRHDARVRLTVALAVLLVALVAYDQGALSPATWIGIALGALVLLGIEHRRRT
jgi:hypothetical protein